MDKLASLVIFAAFIALSCSFPSKEQDSMENEWMETAKMDSEDDELVTRNKVFCPELGLLKHYDVDLSTSHIDCSAATKKRAANLARELKNRELARELSEKNDRRSFSACCSPDCDWLLDYLEIDSTVVKCLDRK